MMSLTPEQWADIGESLMRNLGASCGIEPTGEMIEEARRVAPQIAARRESPIDEARQARLIGACDRLLVAYEEHGARR